MNCYTAPSCFWCFTAGGFSTRHRPTGRCGDLYAAHGSRSRWAQPASGVGALLNGLAFRWCDPMQGAWVKCLGPSGRTGWVSNPEESHCCRSEKPQKDAIESSGLFFFFIQSLASRGLHPTQLPAGVLALPALAGSPRGGSNSLPALSPEWTNASELEKVPGLRGEAPGRCRPSKIRARVGW